MKKLENVSLHQVLLVESLKKIYEKESEELVRNDVYMALEAENNKAENALRAIIKDSPELRAAFDSYCETRTHRECFEEEAMFFEGYLTALRAVGDSDTCMKLAYAKYKMDQERTAS